jgi:hypothetical protein
MCGAKLIFLNISFKVLTLSLGLEPDIFTRYGSQALLAYSTLGRGVATIRHFRHMPTHNCFPNIFLLMKNDKQHITYFNYVCFMFIVLMTSFHKLKDNRKIKLKTLKWCKEDQPVSLSTSTDIEIHRP